MPPFLTKTKDFLKKIFEADPRYNYTLRHLYLILEIFSILINSLFVAFTIYVLKSGPNLLTVYYMKVVLAYFIFGIGWSFLAIFKKDFLLSGRPAIKSLVWLAWFGYAVYELKTKRFTAAYMIIPALRSPGAFASYGVFSYTKIWSRQLIAETEPLVQEGEQPIYYEPYATVVFAPPATKLSFRFNWVLILFTFQYFLYWIFISFVIVGALLYRPVLRWAKRFVLKGLSEEDGSLAMDLPIGPEMVRSFMQNIEPVHTALVLYCITSLAWLVYLSIRKDLYVTWQRWKVCSVWLGLAAFQFVYLWFSGSPLWLCGALAGLSVFSFLLAFLGIVRFWVVTEEGCVEPFMGEPVMYQGGAGQPLMYQEGAGQPAEGIESKED